MTFPYQDGRYVITGRFTYADGSYGCLVGIDARAVDVEQAMQRMRDLDERVIPFPRDANMELL